MFKRGIKAGFIWLNKIEFLNFCCSFIFCCCVLFPALPIISYMAKRVHFRTLNGGNCYKGQEILFSLHQLYLTLNSLSCSKSSLTRMHYLSFIMLSVFPGKIFLVSLIFFILFLWSHLLLTTLRSDQRVWISDVAVAQMPDVDMKYSLWDLRS